MEVWSVILSSSYFQGVSIHVFDVNSLCMYKQKDLSALASQKYKFLAFG